jgi:hypothetical protein
MGLGGALSAVIFIMLGFKAASAGFICGPALLLTFVNLRKNYIAIINNLSKPYVNKYAQKARQIRCAQNVQLGARNRASWKAITIVLILWRA